MTAGHPGTAAAAGPSAAPTLHRRLPIAPGATLGVLGGGQLGRMFVHAAQRMGYRCAVLDPDDDSPAGRVAEHHIRAAYDDPAALDALASLCDAVTTEFENVPAAALSHLAQRVRVAPGATAVAVAQDRGAEKSHFARCGVPCAPHAVIASAADLAAVEPALLPGLLKTARLGYDGKGQVAVGSPAQLREAWSALGRVRCVLEQRLVLAGELSVIVARGADGRCVALPPAVNHHRGGILALSEVGTSRWPEDVVESARAATESIASGFGYEGVLCVEFFMLPDGRLLANEMAPRPHNSGHWSIEGADLSQFELQVRALAGLPLVSPRARGPALMLNLLGDLWWPAGDAADAAPREPDWPSMLALPGVHLHLYGKRAPRPGRKMGHVTVTGADAARVRATGAAVARTLGLSEVAAALAPPSDHG